jgi:hypothetical protein
MTKPDETHTAQHNDGWLVVVATFAYVALIVAIFCVIIWVVLAR